MACPICDDTGWRAGADGDRVVRCECWRAALAAQLLSGARIPRRYQHCDLDNFAAYNESLERGVAAARQLVDRFPVVERGLFLLGPPGVGKTHLLVAVLRQAIQRTGARGLFYDTRDLLRVIRSTYDPVSRTSEIDILRPVMGAELLVLDDLGAEKTSEWVDETLNLIVNTRYNARLPTLFTSNYEDSPDDTDPNSLMCRIGLRMRSRLHEMCDFLDLDAADYRELGPDPSVEYAISVWKAKPRRPGRGIPLRAGRQAKAKLRDDRADLKWSGGRAGS
jgi:DNA replication protein DnaC